MHGATRSRAGVTVRDALPTEYESLTFSKFLCEDHVTATVGSSIDGLHGVHIDERVVSIGDRFGVGQQTMCEVVELLSHLINLLETVNVIELNVTYS